MTRRLWRAGMVMKPEPIFSAVEQLREEVRKTPTSNCRAQGGFDVAGWPAI